MASQARRLAPSLGLISITPFGVDTDHYAENSTPLNVIRKHDKPFIIGTIKSMASVYGVDTLIRSFSLLKNKLSVTQPDIASNLYLRLVGDGPQADELKKLAANLGVAKEVQFVGRIKHLDVPKELERLDIYAALSRSESFGVAIIEAGAAGRPVVVSDAGGLPEVVIDGETGIIVPKENPQAAADAFEYLILNPEMRVRIANAGQKHVQAKYSWDACINMMINVYERTISDYQQGEK
jgi:glycosyltransferase involved in cell wall biosynthesis